VTSRPRPLAGRRILVVEDEFFIADELAQSLSLAGAEVMGPCPTTERASRLMRAEGYLPDAAVLDLNLSGASSVDLVRALTERRVPVVLATGYDTTAIDPELQALPRCQKPFNLTGLVSTLATLLR